MDDHYFFFETPHRDSQKTFDLRQFIINRITTRDSKAQIRDAKRVQLYVGDNGVGKTRMAKIMSLLLSRSAETTGEGEQEDDAGDAYIEFNVGSLVVGRTDREVLTYVTEKLRAHIKKFPHAVIVINDLQNLNERQIQGIFGPLFEGAEMFDHTSAVHGGAIDIDLRKTTVIATMDTEKQGATSGMTYREVQAHVKNRIDALWPKGYVQQRVRIIPFPPFDDEAIMRAVLWHLHSLPCRVRAIRSVEWSDVISKGIYQLTRQAAGGEANGRRVAETFKKYVQDLIVEKIAEFQHRTYAGGDGASGFGKSSPDVNFDSDEEEAAAEDEATRARMRERRRHEEEREAGEQSWWGRMRTFFRKSRRVRAMFGAGDTFDVILTKPEGRGIVVKLRRV